MYLRGIGFAIEYFIGKLVFLSIASNNILQEDVQDKIDQMKHLFNVFTYLDFLNCS